MRPACRAGSLPVRGRKTKGLISGPQTDRGGFSPDGRIMRGRFRVGVLNQRKLLPRKRTEIARAINMIWVAQCEMEYALPFYRNLCYLSRHPVPLRGAYRDRHERGAVVDATLSCARGDCRAKQFVSEMFEFRRHCEERELRSNPAFLLRRDWIASLAEHWRSQ